MGQESSSHGVSRTRWAAVGAAVAVALGAGGLAATRVTNATSSSGERDVFVPITPCRLFDTRATQTVGKRNTPLGPAGTMTQPVTGSNGNCTLPLDASGVAMNVTTVNGTADSFLTIWPADVAQPLASSLNWVAGSPPTPNKVDVKLSADGRISLFNNGGSVDVLADVVGYYVDHDHNDAYYTKAQVDALLGTGPTSTSVPSGPTSHTVTIGGPAFQPSDADVIVATELSGCRRITGSGNSAETLDASVELPVGATVTGITAMLGNAADGTAGDATLIRRNLGSATTLATASSTGLGAGAFRVSAELATPDSVVPGRYYFLSYAPHGVGPSGVVICGAEVRYTMPS